MRAGRSAKQYMEMHNQCTTDNTERNTVGPRQFAAATPAPGPYIPSEGFGGTTPSDNSPRRRTELPALTLTDSTESRDVFQYGGDGKRQNRTVREGATAPLPATDLNGPRQRYVPPPPLPATDLGGPRPLDVFHFGGDGNNRSPRVRDVPLPPIPASDLPPAVPIRRDFFQYSGDGRPNLPMRELPQSTSPNREYRVQPEPFHQDGSEHPGPSSRRRRTLREQLGLPERHVAYRREIQNVRLNSQDLFTRPFKCQFKFPFRSRIESVSI